MKRGSFITTPRHRAYPVEANPHTPQNGKHLSDSKDFGGLETAAPETQALAEKPGEEACGYSPTKKKTPQVTIIIIYFVLLERETFYSFLFLSILELEFCGE